MLALIALGGIAFPQSSSPAQLHVGDPEVDGTFLKPYRNFWKVHRVTSEGKSIDFGNWTDRLDLITVDGKQVWQRTQLNSRPDGHYTLMINVFDPKTVAPISSSLSADSGRFFKRKFNGAIVERDSTSSPVPPKTTSTASGALAGQDPNAKPVHVTTTLDTPCFDFAGGMFGELLVCFPLKEGYKASFPFIAQLTDDLQSATCEVKGKEKIHTESGDFDCFRVETRQPAGILTCWLVKKAPYLIKIDAYAPTWGHTVFEMP